MDELHGRVRKLTLGCVRVFLWIYRHVSHTESLGQVIEGVRGVGAIQIALFFVIWDVMAIFWQFLAIILAFSLAMTKIYVAEKASTLGKDSAEDL